LGTFPGEAGEFSLAGPCVFLPDLTCANIAEGPSAPTSTAPSPARISAPGRQLFASPRELPDSARSATTLAGLSDQLTSPAVYVSVPRTTARRQVGHASDRAHGSRSLRGLGSPRCVKTRSGPSVRLRRICEADGTEPPRLKRQCDNRRSLSYRGLLRGSQRATSRGVGGRGGGVIAL
jgi:hypothetical protein